MQNIDPTIGFRYAIISRGTALGKSSESAQCAHVCACVTGLQHSALYRFRILSRLSDP